MSSTSSTPLSTEEALVCEITSTGVVLGNALWCSEDLIVDLVSDLRSSEMLRSVNW